MKNRGRAYIVAFAFLTMMSCSLNICGYRQGYEREQLNDTQWITQAGDSYTFSRREGTVLPNSATLRFSRFFGKETLWTVKVQQAGSLHIGLSIISPQGPFEVVMVETETKRLIRIAQHLGSSENTYHLEKGIYCIKILGYDASGTVAISLRAPHGMVCEVSTMRF
ncbi:hypothetical protein [Sphaerochaeta sp. PS]|uniref:hypothetical protein n=1 Tax=Sphaerochaeta sp. PS TaxID=3076336 RepID=UPI0028A4F90E|nr:hypothetical protein [Sphaerochaeta sp. PS]MDT4761723.1 hypothetical protein [Sphaerochaeta sp. PS]